MTSISHHTKFPQDSQVFLVKIGARVARPGPQSPKLMVAGGGVLSEGVGDSAVTGPGFLL